MDKKGLSSAPQVGGRGIEAAWAGGDRGREVWYEYMQY